MNAVQAGLFRALAFHEAWGYAPTIVELLASWDGEGVHDVYTVLQECLKEGSIKLVRGRCVFPGQEAFVFEHEERERLFSRKIRIAKRIARWLALLKGVRFVALCNTTALAHARDEGDLDFFIITHAGCMWQTRGLAALPFKFLGMRPDAEADNERDAVCLSFFIDDTALDLKSLQLEDDPYFRHWFLSLLPLFDDGVGEQLWHANQAITQRHPFALPWQVHSELQVFAPMMRVPYVSSLEGWARTSQQRIMPASIRTQANTSTNVVVHDHVLKLHAVDNREHFRDVYYARCRAYGIEP